MRGGFKSLFLRYGFSILLFAAVLGLSLVLRYFGLQVNLTIPIIVAIVGSAWFGGRGPGILICVLIVAVSMLSPSNREGTLIAVFIQQGSVLALLILVVVLVSGRRKAQEESRRQGELFKTTLASIGDAVIATDSDGNISFTNVIADDLIGLRPGQVVGKPLREVFRLRNEETEEDIGDIFERIRSDRSIIVFDSGKLLIRPEASTIPISVSCAPITDPKGGFCGSVIVFQDDTQRRKTEELSRENEHRQQQSQKLEAVGTLTGGVAHDFNNLLTAIIGYTQLALMRLDPQGEIYEDLVNVEKAGNRAAELTKKLLAFSRQQKLESRVIDLNEAIGEMLKLLERVIGEIITVSFKPADDLHAINADPSQIEQVIMNLSLNARDAMPKGGRMVIETRHVVLDEYYCRQYPTCLPGEYVQILVSDTGHGMEQDVLDRIFEPFFTTKDVNQGTGLGLSMVYGIVKQHKGHINVYSEPNQGTTFKVYLPVIPDAEVKKPGIVQPSLLGGSETILVADDEEALRNLSRDVLKALGYTVITAENGGRAVDLYREHAAAIDLLLFDVVMPVSGGVDAYQKIVDLGRHVPVIFMTGYSAEVFDDSKFDLLDIDLLPVIQKPYTLDALGRIVRDTLDAAASNGNGIRKKKE